jgi:hypothetical protein
MTEIALAFLLCDTIMDEQVYGAMIEGRYIGVEKLRNDKS